MECVHPHMMVSAHEIFMTKQSLIAMDLSWKSQTLTTGVLQDAWHACHTFSDLRAQRVQILQKVPQGIEWDQLEHCPRRMLGPAGCIRLRQIHFVAQSLWTGTPGRRAQRNSNLGKFTSQGAARETSEEAGAQFIMEDLLTVMSVPRVGQVHLYYRARLTSDQFDPGHETMEAHLFSEQEIPWEELAFRTVKETLVHYFAKVVASHTPSIASDALMTP
jgi:hypothetical protein